MRRIVIICFILMSILSLVILLMDGDPAWADVCDDRPADLLPKGVNSYALTNAELITTNGGRVDWGSDGYLYFDRKQPDIAESPLTYDIWKRDMTTGIETCITCNHQNLAADAGTVRGMPTISPDGQWMAFQAEHPNHAPVNDPDSVQPGKGMFNDLWVMDLTTGEVWLLNRVSNGMAGAPTGGTLHPQWSHTGTHMIWGDMESGPGIGKMFGEWQMSYAQFSVSEPPPQIPTLSDRQDFNPGPGSWYEPHGFGPTDSIVIYSGDTVNQPVLASDIAYNTVEQLESGCDPIRLTFTSWLYGEPWHYDEHAKFTPGHDAIIWLNDESGIAELWMMNPDGSDRRQVTGFNTPGTTEYGLMGGDFDRNVPSDNSWNPNPPAGQAQLAVYVQADFDAFAGEPGIPLVVILTFNVEDN